MQISCCSDTVTATLLDLFDARTRMLAASRPVRGEEKVALDHAVGRVLVDDVFAHLNTAGRPHRARCGVNAGQGNALLYVRFDI